MSAYGCLVEGALEDVDAHGGNGEDREVSVEQTGSEAEGGSGVGHCR